MSADAATPDLNDLYREIILDHYRRPRNRVPLAAADIEAEGVNPLCGDEVRLQARFDGDRIVEIAALGKGCSISQSSASLMTTAVEGQPLAEITHIRGAFERMMTEEGTEPDASLGDLTALHGVAKFPVRIKCALLSWKVLGEILTLRDNEHPIIVTTE